MTFPEPTSWTLHLAARRRGRAVAVVLVIFFALFGVAALAPEKWGAGGKALIVVLAAVLLLSSIAEFLFPVTYTLDADGAHARVLGAHRVLPWARVRRVYLQPHGIKLSPLAARGWLESYRGVMLRTSERDAVLAQVRAWLEQAGVTLEIIDDEEA